MNAGHSDCEDDEEPSSRREADLGGVVCSQGSQGGEEYRQGGCVCV